MDWLAEIRQRAQTGKPPRYAGRGKQFGKVSWDDLVFLPVQTTPRPVDYYRERVSSETVIGKLAKPIVLRTPILIAAMSFGAISKEAKIALAKASTMAGTATNTGEGGMLPEERRYAKVLIAQYSTGRFGVDEEYIRKADAIEIKLGQGAKPGMGGVLPAEKVTLEIARLRKVSAGKDVHSPAYHPDIRSAKELKEKIKWIKELNGSKPVIVKLAAGRVEADLEFVLKAKPDIVALDGTEAATGAAPAMLDHFGIPTMVALVRARKFLNRKKAKQELWVGGGLTTGIDVAKALALGADAVFMATPMLVAMGCIACNKCFSGSCPVGIATQRPELRKKLNVKEASKKVANFIKACTEEVKMAAAACGKKDVHELVPNDVRSLNLTISKMTGIPLV